MRAWVPDGRAGARGRCLLASVRRGEGSCLSEVYGLDAIGIGKGEELGRERHNAALPLDLLEYGRVHCLPANAPGVSRAGCGALDVALHVRVSCVRHGMPHVPAESTACE